MKIVLLYGGLGTRMREETEYKPKPMVEVGDVETYFCAGVFAADDDVAEQCSSGAV